MVKKRRTDHGFSIVETAVAITVTGLVLVAAAPAVLLANQVTVQARAIASASEMASSNAVSLNALSFCSTDPIEIAAEPDIAGYTDTWTMHVSSSDCGTSDAATTVAIIEQSSGTVLAESQQRVF